MTENDNLTAESQEGDQYATADAGGFVEEVTERSERWIRLDEEVERAEQRLAELATGTRGVPYHGFGGEVLDSDALVSCEPIGNDHPVGIAADGHEFCVIINHASQQDHANQDRLDSIDDPDRSCPDATAGWAHPTPRHHR